MDGLFHGPTGKSGILGQPITRRDMDPMLQYLAQKQTQQRYAQGAETAQGVARAAVGVPVGMAQDIYSAATLPGDVFSGKTQVGDPLTGHTSQDVIERALSVSDLLPLGIAGSVAMKGVKSAMDPNTVRMGAGPSGKPQGIRAYHGSPHKFDKFQMDKLGTGEGAQAYGHGLYFAESEDLAKSYRDALSRTVSDDAGYDLATHAMQRTSLKNNTRVTPNLDDAIKIIKNEIADYDKKGWPSSDYRAQYDQAIEYLSQWKGGEPMLRGTPGSMYEVNINANPDDFLDWDKRLSEQPENVRKAYGRVSAAGDSDLTELLDGSIESFGMMGLTDGSIGGRAYNTLANQMGPATVTKSLSEQGIPGIKYRDQLSRPGKAGTSNYVVFDESVIDILRRYGLIGSAGAAGAMMYDPQTSEGIL